MKKVLILTICIFCLCGCNSTKKSNNNSSKDNEQEIINYIKNHHIEEWVYEKEKVIVDKNDVTIKLYNVDHWTSCATTSNEFTNQLINGNYSKQGIKKITFECLDSDYTQNSYVVIENLSSINNNFFEEMIVMDKNKVTISQSLENGLKEYESIFKQQCTPYTYKEIFRNPENYEGKKIKITGEVIQVMDADKYFQLRVNMTKNEYNHYEDTVFVQLEKDKFNGRIIEDDIITFYGIDKGTVTYQTVMGNETTIPAIDAYFAELQN
ncbi:MAG: hypothetical protein HFI86_04460 [Bacilli bacterium]|nr:hypothetical protein [Bacilli bacterium]